MPKHKSHFDRFSEVVVSHPTENRLTLVRNFSFGAAAACLVVLCEIIQIGAANLPLRIAVMSCAVGIPVWVALGSTYELYISLGEPSYPHLQRKDVRRYLGVLQLAGGAALLTLVGAVFAHLARDAVYAFVGVAGVMVLVSYGFIGGVAKWWYEAGPGKDEGPGS